MDFLFGLVVLIANIWAIIDIVGSSKTIGMKFLWIALVLFLPVVGLLLYVIVGRNRLPHYQ